MATNFAMLLCDVCKMMIKKRQHFIKCCRCKKVLHRTCIPLPVASQYFGSDKSEEDRAAFVCSRCRPFGMATIASGSQPQRVERVANPLCAIFNLAQQLNRHQLSVLCNFVVTLQREMSGGNNEEQGNVGEMNGAGANEEQGNMKIEDSDSDQSEAYVELPKPPVKRGRGKPGNQPINNMRIEDSDQSGACVEQPNPPVKRGRGRPRKVQVPLE